MCSRWVAALSAGQVAYPSWWIMTMNQTGFADTCATNAIRLKVGFGDANQYLSATGGVAQWAYWGSRWTIGPFQWF